MRQYVVVLWAVVNLTWVFFYIKSTIKGDTKPNRVTWLMRSIAPLIASVAAFSDWVRRAVLPVFMSGFAPLLVFISSFFNKKSYRKLWKFDYICGFFSLLALILWYITKNPMIAIVFAIISDWSAALPTIIKSLKDPKSESAIAFITWFFNAFTSFFAIKSFWFSEIAFPLYLCVLNILLITIILRWKSKK